MLYYQQRAMPRPYVHAQYPRLMPIALGTYIVFACSLQSPAKNTGNNVTAGRRHVGLVVDIYQHPTTSVVELSIQTVSRACGPAHLPFAMSIAGPGKCRTGGEASTDTSLDGEASILRVEPKGQHFPWNGCVQWMTREHAALLRVVLQHDDHTNHHGSGMRCRLTSASLLNFAEVAEEACVQGNNKEADLDNIADSEAMPVEIWFDLGLADV